MSIIFGNITRYACFEQVSLGMMILHGNALHIIGLLRVESTVTSGFYSQRASNGIWSFDNFFLSESDQADEQIIEMP